MASPINDRIRVAGMLLDVQDKVAGMRAALKAGKPQVGVMVGQNPLIMNTELPDDNSMDDGRLSMATSLGVRMAGYLDDMLDELSRDISEELAKIVPTLGTQRSDA